MIVWSDLHWEKQYFGRYVTAVFSKSTNLRLLQFLNAFSPIVCKVGIFKTISSSFSEFSNAWALIPAIFNGLSKYWTSPLFIDILDPINDGKFFDLLWKNIEFDFSINSNKYCPLLIYISYVTIL